MIRLQPTSSRGVTLRRSSGSSIAFVICRRATARKGRRSQRLLVSAAVPSSMKAKIALRSRRWRAGKRSKRRCARSRVGEVHLRDRPARRALVDVDVLDDRLDGRTRPGSRCSRCRRPRPAGPRGRRRGATAAVWKAGPAKLSRPGSGGTVGTESWPQAVSSTSASCGPALVCEHPLAALGVPARARAPRSRCGCAPARRGAARRPRGRPGSPPGARSGATSAGSGRTRTRRGATGRRRRRRDRCCDARPRRSARRARRR